LKLALYAISVRTPNSTGSLGKRSR